ncbi:MAG: hypothetical protein KUG83_06055 [Gammaproteobacteria bacterium]|nr:hypothetical protein [Gammaproteobacteria bacterium]
MNKAFNRFRPEAALADPLGIKEQKITSFVKIEPFHDLDIELTTLTCFSLGADWPVDSHLTLGGAYIRGFSRQRNTDIEGPSLALKVRL